jgi:hypothetical protein
MNLADMLQRHEAQQFELDAKIMWCDPRASRPVWEFGTVIGSGYHQTLYGKSRERRVDYRVWEDKTDGARQFDLVPEHQVILKAGRDPYRACWSGVVELTHVWQHQLFAYDFEVDGNDTEVVAAVRGRFVGDSTGDHESEAVLVLKHTDHVQVCVNVYTLWDWATGARDMGSMP